eukprot:jgi/Chrzof1/4936/Cz15g05070.t1
MSTVDMMEKGVPARMKVHKIWSSCRPAAANLTVVTAVTLSRLNQLQAQCKSWKGPLSAALWLPLMQEESDWMAVTDSGMESIDFVDRMLDDFHDRVEAMGKCQLDLLLLHEAISDHLLVDILAVNTARDHAILHAKTPLMAMVDVDLLLSSNLYGAVKDPAKYQKLHDLCATKNVVILPAFETNKYSENMGKAHALAEVAASMDKRRLYKEMVQEDSVCFFNQYKYRPNHNCTLYPTWYNSTDYYQIKPCNKGYEPWFITHRYLNNWYDARFRGYGWNKISHVHQTNETGFSFLVHPESFIVHRQHPKSKVNLSFLAFNRNRSKGIKEVFEDADNPETVAHYDIMRTNKHHVLKIEADRRHGNLNVTVHSSILSCQQTLPWWSDRKRL